MDYLCSCMSETSNVCNTVEGHCLEVMKIVHHHANSRFDRLISEQQSVNPSREATSILSVWEIQKIYVCPSCEFLLGYKFIQERNHCF